MHRLHAPAVLGLTGLLSISAACDLEYEYEALDDIETAAGHIRLPPKDGDAEPPPVRQSSDLRGPTQYLYTPTSGVRWPTPFGTAPVGNLMVESDLLIGTARSLFGTPTTVAGKDFEGATFDMVFRVPYQNPKELPRVRRYEVTDVRTLSELETMSESGLANLPLHVTVEPSALHVYKLETNADYDKDGIPDGLLCEAPSYDRDNPVWQYAVAVPVDWDYRGKATATARSSKFTFACLNSAAAKCRVWGYELRPDTYGYGYVKRSLAAVNACTRMVMADYCGSGFSYTMDGTQIDMADNMRINGVGYYGHDRAGQKPEALWGKDGIYCMSDYRIKNSPRRIVDNGVLVSHYGWHNGHPIGLQFQGDSPLAPGIFCQGTTPYQHEVRTCEAEDIERATLPHGKLGYNIFEDVVISNSSDSPYWIVVNKNHEQLQELPTGIEDDTGDTTPPPTTSLPTVPSLPPVFQFPSLP